MEMISQEEIDWLAKLAKSAGNGGYVLDHNGKPCFDGDVVKMVTDYQSEASYAKLSYDKELRRWFVYFYGDTYHAGGECSPLSDNDFYKSGAEKKW